MLLGTRAYPRTERWARGVSSGGCNEFVSSLTKRTVRTECNRFEPDGEALLFDDLVRSAVLGGSVGVAEGFPRCADDSVTTHSPRV